MYIGINYPSNYLTGAQTIEIVVAHLINQFKISIFQTILILVALFYVFNTTCIGSIPLVFFISILLGLCGMCFGKHKFE